MKKTLKYEVLVTVDDKGSLDEYLLRENISQSIALTQRNGDLLSISDTTSEVIAWEVSYKGEQPPR